MTNAAAKSCQGKHITKNYIIRVSFNHALNATHAAATPGPEPSLDEAQTFS
jgi:hypothetical protein